jgi:hypothetical protein
MPGPIQAVVLILCIGGFFAAVIIALVGTVDWWVNRDADRSRRVSFKTLERINKTHPHGK